MLGLAIRKQDRPFVNPKSRLTRHDATEGGHFARGTRWALALLIFAPATFATDGVFEINQTCVVSGCFSGDAAGFPVTIGVAGSYRLTSELILVADVDAILISANDVTLDLNGFRIDGPSSCAPISCTTGISDGIGSPSALTGQRVSVKNGTVTGFSGTCVSLSALAHVSGLTIQSCGERGIDVGVGSVVLNNSVGNVGEEGLRLASTSIFGHNTILGNGLANASALGVAGGTPSAGNACEDGSCQVAVGGANDRRRYYLSQILANGSQATAFGCIPGFHMAHLAEIFNPSGLAYDTTIGHTHPDSGNGPPSDTAAIFSSGWIRTGGLSVGNVPFPLVNSSGVNNCEAYTSSDSLDFGTTVAFSSRWRSESEEISPWRSSLENCDSQIKVWCVED